LRSGAEGMKKIYLAIFQASDILSAL